MNAEHLKGAMNCVAACMADRRDELIALDQQNGDGDLGISMDEGFRAVVDELGAAEQTDLGRLLLASARAFNRAAPSSLGTIFSFGMMGMAQTLQGKEEASLDELATAMQAGLALIMEKARSRPGEKTVLDALLPAVEALKKNADKGAANAFSNAAIAAETGSESTRDMRSVHGRAAYYGDDSIGVIDGGSVAGKYLFQSLATYASTV